MLRLAFVAEQRARFLVGKRDHLRSFRDRLGELELSGINPFEVGMAPGPRRGTPVRRSAERAQVDIFDARFRQRIPERRLRKTRTPRVRHGAHVDQPFDPG